MKFRHLLLVLALLGATALAQTATGFQYFTAIQGAGNLIRVIPSAPIVVCAWPPTGATPCTNLLTTYNDPAQDVTCPGTAQVVWPGSNICEATSSPSGNFTFFGPPGGNAAYYLKLGAVWQGPFVVTLPGGGTGSGTVTSIASGTGLSGGPITSNGTLSVNSAVVPLLANANAFTSTNSFGGAVTLSAGGSLAGTFSGSPTLSGNPTFSGTPVFSNGFTFSGPFTATSLTATGLTVGQTPGVKFGGQLGSRANEFHSADIAGPTLESLLSLCPASPTPCNIVLDPSSSGMLVASGTMALVNTSNSGTGGCSSNTVTWQSSTTNTQFSNWTGNTVNIGGTTYTVASFQSATVLCLTSAPGTQTGVAFNAPVTIGGTSQSVTVENRGVNLQCQQNFGTGCIAIAQGGNLKCELPGRIGTISGCVVNTNSSANYASLVSNAEFDGLQTQFYLSGHSITASGTATIARGLLDIVAVEGKGTIKDVLIQGIANTIDVSLEDGSSGTADNNALTFVGGAWYCSGAANCISLNIVSGGGTGTGSVYTFNGVNLGDPGKLDGSTNPCSAGLGGGCVVNIDGSAVYVAGTGFVTGSIAHYLALISFTPGLYIEGCTAGGSCTTTNVQFVAAKNVKAIDFGSQAYNVGPVVDNCTVLGHTVNPNLGAVHLRWKVYGSAKCTNNIRNTVTGYTNGNATFEGEYTFPGEQAGFPGWVLDGGAGVTSGIVSVGNTQAGLAGTGACATITTQSGGQWAGTGKCTGTTGASTLTITPGSTAPHGWVCNVQDQTTPANQFQQTSFTTTTCVLTVTSVTVNDVFVFSALAF